jgi:hypothetical protein
VSESRVRENRKPGSIGGRWQGWLTRRGWAIKRKPCARSTMQPLNQRPTSLEDAGQPPILDSSKNNETPGLREVDGQPLSVRILTVTLPTGVKFGRRSSDDLLRQRSGRQPRRTACSAKSWGQAAGVTVTV